MRFIIILFSILFYGLNAICQDEILSGLFFSSHEVIQEKRTSLNLTPSGACKYPDGFSLEMEANFRRGDGHYGYIFRIIGDDHTNIDLVTNLASTSSNFWLVLKDKVLVSYKWADVPHGGFDQWIKLKDFKLDSIQGVTKDEDNGRIFFVNNHAVYILSTETSAIDTVLYAGGKPYNTPGRQIIYNKYTNELWSYNFYNSEINKFSFTTNKWTLGDSTTMEPRFWQHNKFISPIDSSLVTLFGYGFYTYKRILHCHINPSVQRFFSGGFSRAIVDAVIAKKTFAYTINHTDNAQLIDLFTFGTYGGILPGEESYGQLTNFNFDCVNTGIYKKGNNTKNQNWQISQGSIIANCGEKVQDVHPIIIEGQGHTSLSNVEAFSGGNGALTTVPENQSWDFLLVKGDKKLTISIFGSRMRNYVADNPITIENNQAIIQAVACFDKDENLYNKIFNAGN